MFVKMLSVWIFGIALMASVKQSECSTQQPSIQTIDTLVQGYLKAEQYLWHLVHSTDIYSNDATLSHIYNTHNEYLGTHFGETGIFDGLVRQQKQQPQHQKYDEQRIMERHTQRIIDNIEYINITALNTYRFLNHRQFEPLPKLMYDILENMPKSISTLSQYADFNFWTYVKNNSQVCYPNKMYVLSENQVLSEFYTEAVAALLKGYMTLQMCYMIQTANAFTNYRDRAEKLREHFLSNVTLIQDDIKIEIRNASRAMWACDPDDYVAQDSFIEISRFHQGYVDNEVNMNEEGNCRQTCYDLTKTKHYQCAENTFCRGSLEPWEQSKVLCKGEIVNCQYFDGNLNICPDNEYSVRRYKFLEYDDGRKFGGESKCEHLSVIRAESHWSFLFHCSNCFCYCDEPGPYSDRYFSLRAVVSNTKGNKVITGVGITKINRIIQFQIAEGELLSNGKVDTFNSIGNSNPSPKWRYAQPFSVDDFDVEEGVDYHTLSWHNRSIDLDTVIDSERVVTGIRFRVVHSHLRLEVRVTSFDYQTGKLVDVQHSKWISNDSNDKKMLQFQQPDRPTRTPHKSIPIQGHNLYAKFQPSDIYKDAAQSTIPFIDATPVESLTPLAGVGLYLKTQYGYGGFVAPKLIVFDSSLSMTPINHLELI